MRRKAARDLPSEWPNASRRTVAVARFASKLRRMSPFSSIEMHRAEHRFALAVVGAFLAGGLAWVFLTDLVLYAITRRSRSGCPLRDREGVAIRIRGGAPPLPCPPAERVAAHTCPGHARLRSSRASRMESCSSGRTGPSCTRTLRRCARSVARSWRTSSAWTPTSSRAASGFRTRTARWSRRVSSSPSVCSRRGVQCVTRPSCTRPAERRSSSPSTAAAVRSAVGAPAESRRERVA